MHIHSYTYKPTHRYIYTHIHTHIYICSVFQTIFSNSVSRIFFKKNVFFEIQLSTQTIFSKSHLNSYFTKSIKQKPTFREFFFFWIGLAAIGDCVTEKDSPNFSFWIILFCQLIGKIWECLDGSGGLEHGMLGKYSKKSVLCHFCTALDTLNLCKDMCTSDFLRNLRKLSTRTQSAQCLVISLIPNLQY